MRIILEFENKEFNSAEELYNYITEKYKGLREHSDVREFIDTEVSLVSATKNNNRLISVMQFKVGYDVFNLNVIKEII